MVRVMQITSALSLLNPPQIDTNALVKRENNGGNASLSQLLLTSPFSSTESTRFAPNDNLGPSSGHMDMDPSGTPTGQVLK